MGPLSHCAICDLHHSPPHQAAFEVLRTPLWVLRHHPDPAPLLGWLLLDSRRHLPGPLAFTDQEAADWGLALRQASRLVQQLTGCERVYGIAFGEGAPHLHQHLIPRWSSDPASTAWRVADLYRAVAAGERPPADPAGVAALVQQARQRMQQHGITH
jgi:diadenosine tetraphosphate (Ap4A) HIT family hydrolase